MSTPEQTAKIRELNDQFRTNMVGGMVSLTEGVINNTEDVRAQILMMVASFNTFDDNNDPHSEHDFGSVSIADETYFWKIDYYDLKLEGHSEDAANPEITKRVMTIMHSSEY